MKLIIFAALAALCAVAESASALPVSSDRRGGAATAELQARLFRSSSSHKSSSASSKPRTSPAMSHPLSPLSDSGSAGSAYETAPSSPVSSTHSPPHSSGPSSQSALNKPLPQLPEPAEQSVQPSQHAPPSSAPQHSTTATDEAAKQSPNRIQQQQLETAQAALNETKKNNVIMQNIGKTAAGIAGLGVAGGLGFGVWNAQETYHKDHPNQQQAQPAANQTANSTEQAPAQPTAQPVARRAIIDGEMYELYWVK